MPQLSSVRSPGRGLLALVCGVPLGPGVSTSTLMGAGRWSNSPDSDTDLYLLVPTGVGPAAPPALPAVTETAARVLHPLLSGGESMSLRFLLTSPTTPLLMLAADSADPLPLLLLLLSAGCSSWLAWPAASGDAVVAAAGCGISTLALLVLLLVLAESELRLISRLTCFNRPAARTAAEMSGMSSDARTDCSCGDSAGPHLRVLLWKKLLDAASASACCSCTSVSCCAGCWCCCAPAFAVGGGYSVDSLLCFLRVEPNLAQNESSTDVRVLGVTDPLLPAHLPVSRAAVLTAPLVLPSAVRSAGRHGSSIFSWCSSVW